MVVTHLHRCLLTVPQISVGMIESYLASPTRQLSGFELIGMSDKEVVDVGVDSDCGCNDTDAPAVSESIAKSDAICCTPVVVSVDRLNRSKTGSDRC